MTVLGSARHVPAEVVANRHTIGAGDAFAAVLAAQRGAGLRPPRGGLGGGAGNGPLPRQPRHRRQSTPWIRPSTSPSWTIRRGALRGSAPIWPTLAPPETEFSLEVQGDRLAGRSGCNRYMGSWAIEDGRLQIGQLASTLMFCDGLMELEDAFLAALQGTTSADA